MISVRIISVVPVFLGILFMLASIALSVLMNKDVPAMLRVRWRVMTYLILFFLAGYVAFIVIQIKRLPFPLELVTGSVFLGGAFFVFLVINLTKDTIERIKMSESRVGEVNQTLVQKNEELRREIIERKHAEDKLLTITSTANDAIIMMNERGRITFWNNAAERIFGYAAAEALDRDLHFFIAPERFQEPFRRHFPGFLETGDGPAIGKTVEVGGLRKDGEELPIELSLASVQIAGLWHAVGIVRDITQRKEAEKLLQNSLREKELLLREIHHRVKNNMQIISSLLKLQSKHIDDPMTLETLNDSQDRIRAMALIHEALYKSTDLASVDFRDYIKNLAANLFSSHGAARKAIRLKTEIEDLTMQIDSAIPCGLIINELVTNSLKYAFPAGRSGEIFISIKKDGGDNRYELIVKDNGIGLPADLDIHNTKSVGLQLVVNLCLNQLQGEIETEGDNGAGYVIKFEQPNYKDRI